jgi:tetratricopeptide (TPR) repeat protein
MRKADGARRKPAGPAMATPVCFALATLIFLMIAAESKAGPNEDFQQCIFPDVSQPGRVIAACTRLINSRGDDANARAMVYLSRGNMFRRRHEYDRALADYNESLRLRPDYAPAYTSRGNAWRGKGERDRAIADHSDAIRLAPDYAEAYNNRGNVWADMKEWERAIADYDRAIALKPVYPIAFFNRALVFRATGERDREIADLREALRLDPGMRPAADVLKELGVTP